VYIEGSGSLIGKCSDYRCYYGGTAGPPRPSTDQNPQGGPYGDGVSLTESPSNGSAAGIGSGDVGGSGGNVVIRGNPTVIGISGAHGAGIGGSWSSSGPNGSAYHSDILIYGGTVESWGGDHGAGIGGGCTGGDGTIVALPTAKVTAASYSAARPALGQMANVIYFGNPADARLAIYTEDYRETAMYLDLSKNDAVNKVIQRMAGELNPAKLLLGTTRNDYVATQFQHRPNLADWEMTTILDGSTKYGLLLNGAFKPANAPVSFFTDAKTEKNFPYQPVSTTVLSTIPATGGGLNKPTDDFNSGNSVPRFVMVAPTYEPQVALTPNSDPAQTMFVDYDDTEANTKTVKLTFSNSGNQRLYNPYIQVIGPDFFLLGGNPNDPIQSEVDSELASLLLSDAQGPYIPTGSASFDIDVRLKQGKNPGIYSGWILFGADNLPENPQPIEFKIEVIRPLLPAPLLSLESPAIPQVNGPYTVRAKFRDRDLNPNWPVTAFDVLNNVFVNHGTVTAITPDLFSTTVNIGGVDYYSEWLIDVTPAPATLPSNTPITLYVKKSVAEDEFEAKTETASENLVVTYNTTGPRVSFNVMEGAILSALDTIIIHLDGNSITSDHPQTVYLTASGYAGGYETTTTSPDMTANLRGSLSLDTVNTPTINLSADYELKVVDTCTIKIGSPPAGFANGDYTLTIPPNYVFNYEGNELGLTVLNFKIRTPKIDDGTGVSILPGVLPYSGGTATISIVGENLKAAGSNLQIEFPTVAGVSGFTGQVVPVPVDNVADDGLSAFFTVALPPNLKMTTEPYDFTVLLQGRKDASGNPAPAISPLLTTIVDRALPSIDTLVVTNGVRQGLVALPPSMPYEGGQVSLTVTGENLFQYNNGADWERLRIRVKQDGQYTSTVIPVPTALTQGAVTVPLSYAAAKNTSGNDIVYVFELWVYDRVMSADTHLQDVNLVYLSDSVTVRTGIDRLKFALESDRYVVHQVVANTNLKVKDWVLPILNSIPEVQSLGLTIAPEDVTMTRFEEAISGWKGNPGGIEGSFTFDIVLHLNPDYHVTVNIGRIIPVPVSTVEITRELILPEVAGVIIDPPAGDHHVTSGSDFTFYLNLAEVHAGKKPIVTTNRIEIADDGIVVAKREDVCDDCYLVTIREVRQPLTVSIRLGDEVEVGNEEVEDGGAKVWSAGNRLYIAPVETGSARVFTVSGQLQASLALTAGREASIQLPPGVYLISLNTGRIYKAVIK
jgi:hypothetical protein